MMQANQGMLDAYGIEGCGCARCVGSVIASRPFPENMFYPFIICDTCGNKRCPHATDHEFVCTASNKPGQAAYRVGEGE